MKTINRISGMVLFASLCLAGCSEKSAGSRLWFRLRSTSAEEMVEMAFDPSDADNRRRGITLLSERQWGLQEPYLKGYAMLLDKDDDPLVRSAAVRALGKAGDANYLPNMIEAMEDKSAAVRWDAAEALGLFDDARTVDPLRRHAVEDESMDVRVCCARSLVRYRDEKVVRTLKECLLDEEFSVRHQARTSLVAIVGRDCGYEPDDWTLLSDSDSDRTETNDKSRPWWDWRRATGRRETSAGGEAVDSTSATVEAKKDTQ